MYGKTLSHAMVIYVYSSTDNALVNSFSSQIAAAKWLNISNQTVSVNEHHVKLSEVQKFILNLYFLNFPELCLVNNKYNRCR
jgi:hypothetical protein